MAENIAVNFIVGGLQEAQTDLNNTAKSMMAVSKATESATSDMQMMGDAIEQIKKEMAGLDPASARFKQLSNEVKVAETAIESLSTSSESLKAELTRTKNEINSLGQILDALKKQGLQNTEGFKNLQAQFEALKKKGGELKDQIGDLNKTFSTLGSDTRKIDTLVQGLQGIAAGMQIAQGASALFGDKNKALEESLVKLNGAMAIANGVQQLGNLIQKETAIGTALNTAATTAYTFVTEGATLATQAFRAALVATGVGALIALLGTAVSYLMDFTTSTNDATKATDKQKKAEEELKKSIDETNQSLKDRDKINEYVGKLEVLNAKARGASIKELRRIEDENDNKEKIAAAERFQLLRDQAQAVKNNAGQYAIAFKAQEEALKDWQKVEQDINLKAGQRKVDDFIKFSEKEKKEAAELYKRLSQLLQQYADEEAQKGKESIDRLFKNANDKKAIEEQALKDRIKKAKEEYEALLSEDEKYVKDLEAAYNEDLANSKNKNKDKLIYEKQILDERLANNQNEQQKLFDLFKNGNITLEEYEKENTKLLDKEAEIRNKIRENEGKQDDAAIEKRKKVLQTALDGAKVLTDTIFTIDKQNRDAALQEELDNINKKKEEEVRGRDLSEQQKAAIDKKYRAQEAAAKLRAWKAEQEAKRSQAIINGALAVGNVMATTPFPAWIFTIPLAIAKTAAEVAIISAQKPPKFKEGGSVAKRLGYIDGKPHSAGGEVIEVEGGEYVMRTEAVKKYGLPMLDAINKMEIPKPNESKSIGIDYNKMGDIIAEKLNKNPMVRVQIDKRGVNTYMGNYERKNNYIDF